MITLSPGDDWEDNVGATVILRNSAFKLNTAESGSAGVVYLGDYSTLVVAGDENVFEANTCGEDGGVFAGTTNTTIFVEGGVFRNNQAYRVRDFVPFIKNSHFNSHGSFSTLQTFWQPTLPGSNILAVGGFLSIESMGVATWTNLFAV